MSSTSTLFALQVSPSIPEPLRRLNDLAGNFWFSWYPATGQLFRKLDAALWRDVYSKQAFGRADVERVAAAAGLDPTRMKADMDGACKADLARHGIRNYKVTSSSILCGA